jgi:hypothetical protein
MNSPEERATRFSVRGVATKCFRSFLWDSINLIGDVDSQNVLMLFCVSQVFFLRLWTSQTKCELTMECVRGVSEFPHSLSLTAWQSMSQVRLLLFLECEFHEPRYTKETGRGHRRMSNNNYQWLVDAALSFNV